MRPDGGPAFPCQDLYHPTTGEAMAQGAPGMSLRDWLAGQALAGLAVGCAGLLGKEADGSPHFSAYAKGPCNSVLANRAYALADAMLKQRES